MGQVYNSLPVPSSLFPALLASFVYLSVITAVLPWWLRQ